MVTFDHDMESSMNFWEPVFSSLAFCLVPGSSTHLTTKAYKCQLLWCKWCSESHWSIQASWRRWIDGWDGGWDGIGWWSWTTMRFWNKRWPMSFWIREFGAEDGSKLKYSGNLECKLPWFTLGNGRWAQDPSYANSWRTWVTDFVQKGTWKRQDFGR